MKTITDISFDVDTSDGHIDGVHIDELQDMFREKFNELEGNQFVTVKSLTRVIKQMLELEE